jgi:hypothetical protein
MDDRKRPAKPNQDVFHSTNLAHNLAVTDVYCAFAPHTEDGESILTEWARQEDSALFRELYYDAFLKVYGQEGFLEVERGNHPVIAKDQRGKVSREYYSKSLNAKFDRYEEWFSQHPFAKRLLLIVVEDWSGGVYDPKGTDEWILDIVKLAAEYKMSQRVLVSHYRDVCGDKDEVVGEIHNEALGNPFGEIWLCPAYSDEYISIAQAIGKMAK